MVSDETSTSGDEIGLVVLWYYGFVVNQDLVGFVVFWTFGLLVILVPSNIKI